MWNSAKDPQEEKYQQKLEAILEEKHRAISDRSHLLLNIIFVVLGAYAVLLSARPVQLSSFPLDNILTLSIPTNIHYDSISALLIQTFLLIQKNFPFLCLSVSISYIFVAFLTLLHSVEITDMEFINKFEIENGPIQASRYVKDGEELVNRNNQLISNTKILLDLNHRSVLHLSKSLLLFITFISVMISPGYFILFIIVFIFLMRYYNKISNKRENEIKQL